jgi:hypothetical protein
LSPDARPARYSAADLAGYLGPETARDIQVVFLTGCNDHGALDVDEWRAAFPNVLHIIHAAAGDVGYQPMLLQVLFSPSAAIQPLFETAERDENGDCEYFLTSRPSPKATRMAPYIVESFRPGETTPHRRQIAGREFLQPQ